MAEPADEPDGPGRPPPEPREDEAARAALARAQQAAAKKGLRPGMAPPRRSARARTEPTYSGTADDERDPVLIGDQMQRLMGERGWQVDVSAGAVMARWPQIVGPEISAHCQPVTFEEGVLTVRADSTAWATQLRLMSAAVLGRVEAEVGAGTVQALKVTGPAAPSWRKGFRRVHGRGPRDTFG